MYSRVGLYVKACIDIPLASGNEILFYIKDLGNVSIEDVGTTCSIVAFTANSQYIVKCNIESATIQ